MSRARRTALAAVALSQLLVAAAAASPPDAEGEPGGEPEIIDLAPEDKVGWSVRNLFAPLSSVFRGGPGYYYDERRLWVRTTPPGATVDLFYVRANFQKRFEQAETPVIVLLPPRIEASKRDALTIRAFREGYRQRSVTINIASDQQEVIIDLEPLPNTLQAVSHRYFAGRASLSFLTDELLEFRIQQADRGFTLILNETALSPAAAETLEGVRSPLVEGLFAQQLGEDLVVQIDLDDGAAGSVKLRSRQARDAARDLYTYSVDLVPADGGAEAVQRALDALGRLATSDVSGCAMAYDAALREALEAGSLARALAPRGAFTDKYVRAAMRRLGELTPGGVAFAGGARFDPGQPMELEAALSRAGSASGFLVLLRRFVDGLEAEPFRRDTLRGLVAPELDAARFDAAVRASEAAERACRAAS